ncbi:hypothetical protein FF011L_52850 [Roseimaritima multifibrata]|uniref:Zinc-ribbon 15 domain-containing protein n=2 Tax=Roseimaritima multifibrata TaxID=1930274 RepID=A0A517MNM4_9BACT|nr:hypothetical protein FF011L_52850 [Roseimaritima multifibrata]
MIVVGTMNLTRTAEKGDFVCPECRTWQNYRIRSRRPYLTIYFLPVVPVGGAQRVLQCLQCSQFWDERVLQRPDSHAAPNLPSEGEEESVFREQLMQAAVHLAIAEGEISEQMIASLLQIASERLGILLDRESLGEYCSIAFQNKIGIRNYLLSVDHTWSESQFRMAIQTLFLVASVEAGVSATEQEVLQSLKERGVISDEQFQQDIESLVN